MGGKAIKIQLYKLSLFSTVLLFVAAGILLQQQIYMSNDISWHVLIAQRLLQGGSYTKDFMDISPPAIMYTKLPIIWLMNALHLSMPSALRMYMFILNLGALWLCWNILNQLYDQRDFFRISLLITLTFCFFCLPLFELGQRDDMVLVLTMPWFLAYACAWQDKPLSLSVRILTAVSAAIGFLIHLFYLPIYFVLEAYFIYKKRRVAWLENSIILLITAAYLLSIVIFTPDYITLILPLVSWIYLGMFHMDMVILLCSLTALGAFSTLLVFFLVNKSNQHKPLLYLFVFLLILFFITFIITGKLWYYHMLLTLALTLLLLTGLLCETIKSKERTLSFLIIALFFFPLAQFGYSAYYSVQKASPDSQLSLYIQLVKKYSEGGSVYVFSDRMWPQILIPYAHVNIASRMAPSWLALGIINKEKTQLTEIQRQRLDQIKHMQFKIMSEDLLKYQPSLIMTPKYAPDYIHFFKQDPAFNKIWLNYKLCKEMEEYNIFCRTVNNFLIIF